MAAWMTSNVVLLNFGLWGIEYFLLAFPPAVLWASWLAAAASGAMTCRMLVVRTRAGHALPATGMVAYGVSLYFWQLFVVLSPVWLLLVPSLHSLQYLAVVWRFEINRAKDAPDATARTEGRFLQDLLALRYQRRFLGFVLIGILFGAALFWGAPLLLEGLVAHPRTAEGGLVFLFAFWVFVNVHHYFIDNVIWRSENPESRKYLFA